jgi:transposase
LVRDQAAEITRLRDRVEELERRLAANSQNSSRPPSSDGPVKPVPRSVRKRTGRRPGKQAGEPGAALRQVEVPDEVVDHVPAACGGCGGRLPTGVDAAGVDAAGVDGGVVRRQVFDLPPVRVHVTEHRLHRRCCRRCGVVTTVAAPQGVTAPASYGPRLTALAGYLLVYQHIPVARCAELLADVAQIPVSTGWVAGVTSTIGNTLTDITPVIDAAIAASAVAHFDETGVKVNGQSRWLHVAATATATSYYLHTKRGQTAMDAFDILPRFTGIAVHDGYRPYHPYPCAHALCNAHHLRELAAAADTHPDQTWPTQAAGILEDLNRAAHTARANDQPAIPDHILKPLTDQWRHILLVGLGHHPAQPGRAQTKTRNLLLRLRDYHTQVLHFAHNLTVPFTNNQAERDLRMIKTQLKISGGWRTTQHAETWLNIRGYISTARKNQHNPLTALHTAITGNPYQPPLPE